MPLTKTLILGLSLTLAFPLLAQNNDDDWLEAVSEAVGEALLDEFGDRVEPSRPAGLPVSEGFEWLRADGFETLVCPFHDRIDYEPGQIECGLIRVPENREVEGSRTIELHFVRLVARGEDHDGEPVEVRPDPVIYLTGGPGVTVEGYVRRLKDHRLLAQRDLYILEQRGIGYSGDFCPFFAGLNRADQIRPSFAESSMAFMDQVRRCVIGAREAGIDVTGYHTFENARDVRALRLALGLDSWNVWGISYGSVLGQAYLRVDPDGIRAAVIDAIVPLDLEQLMRISHWHARNLDMLFAACDAQPRCARVFRDLKDRHLAAISAISEQPIGLDIEPSEMFPTGRAYFFQDLVAGLPFQLLYEESTHPAIPAIIHGLTRAVERRDERLFRALALTMAGGAGGGGYSVSMGMSIAVRCQDGYTVREAESAPGDFRDYPILAGAFGHLEAILAGPALCREVGLAPRDPAEFALVETDLPVLVVNGAWDPITPVPLAEYIMPGFTNGQLLIFPHAGHGPTRSVPCGGDLMNAYFDDPTAPLDRDCVDSGQDAAQYLAPYFRTRAAVRGLIMYHEQDRRFKVVAAWGGAAAGLSVLGFIGLFMSWLNRRFNPVRLKAAGGSRFLVFLGTAVVLTHVIGLGLAARASARVTEALLLFGMVPWALWFAWAGPLALLLGALGLVQSFRYGDAISLWSRLGLLLTALGVIALSLFTLFWGLWPF